MNCFYLRAVFIYIPIFDLMFFQQPFHVILQKFLIPLRVSSKRWSDHLTVAHIGTILGYDWLHTNRS